MELQKNGNFAIGKISSVEFKGNAAYMTIMRVNENDKKISYMDLVYFGFLQVREGDIINCRYEENANPNSNVYTIPKDSRPFVQQPSNRDSIIKCFIKVLRKGNAACIKIYEILKKLCTNNEDVSSKMASISEAWVRTKDEYLLDYFSNAISKGEAKVLLIWWHKERNLRRLYLLGISETEINESKMTCEEIYNQCKINPYVVHTIPISTCDSIIRNFGLELDERELICGKILRFIWDCMKKRTWSCVKKSYLIKQEGFYKHFADHMVENYGIIECENYVQLEYPNKVENAVSKFLINLAENDWVKYDTPLDVEIDGKIRLSANYSKNLSEDQMKAVQGALDHTLCVITGSAGTGKCMAPGTKILMFDSSFKNIEDIKRGEKIMGPDSKYRTVLSTCSGIDQMYKIIPEKGDSFSCNERHVLTLKNPFGDIYDIPLEDYIKKSNDSFLFHVGVKLPYKQLYVNPFTAGYLIGNKPIPDEFKINHENERSLFLEGFCKRAREDGNIFDDFSEFEFKLKGDFHKEDIKFLFRSLDYLIYEKEDYLQVEMNSPINFEIEKLSDGEYYGFELDGDGRYLLSDFLVTHNTTTIQQITHNLDLRGETYAICSFTGKAVSRIKEVTGKQNASTIDRLIANSTNLNRLNKEIEESGTPGNRFEHVIIDEASMVTTELFYRFIEAFPDIKKITLVGDINQLPPIGWGSLLYEIMNSKTVPVYHLINNHRFYYSNNGTDADGIILNANKIITHNAGPFEFEVTDEYQNIDNFNVIDGGVDRVVDILHEMKAANLKPDDIMILCPYNDELGELNSTFQGIFTNRRNPQTFVIDPKGRRFNIGDRVIHKENDYEINVFNGTEGYVKSISKDGIYVTFKNIGTFKFFLVKIQESYPFQKTPSTKKDLFRGKTIDKVYDGYETDKECDGTRSVERLDLAFAITIDKSQGSERDYVIIYVPDRGNKGQKMFVNKNRTYTGITRTSFCCYVIGHLPTIKGGINHTPFNRIERLSLLLKESLESLKSTLTLSEIKNKEMMEMYDMDESDLYDCDDFY